MLAYIVSAMLLFSWIIKDVEQKLVERKLYVACGLGVVLGTGSDIIMILGGINGYSENTCLLYTSPSPRDLSTSRMPSSA